MVNVLAANVVTEDTDRESFKHDIFLKYLEDFLTVIVASWK